MPVISLQGAVGPAGPPGLCPVVGSGRSQVGHGDMPTCDAFALEAGAAGPCWAHRSQAEVTSTRVLKTSLPSPATASHPNF